jgi:hypothetical protein
MSKRCPCADPPPGEIFCNDEQLGVCGVIGGKLVVGCFDPPSHVGRIADREARQLATDNWVLSFVSQTGRGDSDAISYTERRTLRQGYFEDPKKETSVRFSRPNKEEEPVPQATPMARTM